MEGFKRASGDIIFPCDQDDIWDCEKIKEMTSVMESNSQINVLASNLIPFYDNTKQNISSFYTNTIGKNYLEKVELDLLFLQTFRPGCSLAFRREFLDLVNLVWYPEWAHDSVLSTTAKLTNSFYVINRVLLYYRRHENVNSPQNIKNVKGRVETAQSYIHRANLFLDKSTELRLNPGTIMTIEKVKHFYLKKIECFQKRNSCIGFLNLLKYVRYYPSWKSFWGDIYIMLLSK